MALAPGAREFLERLGRCGVKVGIATSNEDVVVRAALEALGLEGVVEKVVTQEMVERPKPEPDVFVRAAKELGVKEEEEEEGFGKVVVFEDSMANGYGAASVGMKVCAVFNPNSKKTAAMWNGFTKMADYFVRDSFDEI